MTKIGDMKTRPPEPTRFLVAAFITGLLAAGCAGSTAPPQRLTGRWHVIKPGQSLEEICKKYDAEPEVVSELNDLPDRSLARREEIFVPTRGGRAPGAWRRSRMPRAESSTEVEPKKDDARGRSTRGGHVRTGSCPRDKRECLVWPVKGELIAVFGPRQGAHHDGLDIAAPRGTEIAAADAGLVIYSGDEIQGYGNLVILRHDSGLITVYAHNEKNLVSQGQKVARGQSIATVGSTGAAVRDHVHFEVRTAQEPKDPLPLLPPRE